MIDTLAQDLRYALRTLARSPGFTLVAVLTLALGIGASTAVYTALERVVLDPLPYPEAGRLVQLKSAVPGVAPGAEWNVSAGAWFFFRDQARTIDALGTYQRSGATVLAPDGPQRARAAAVTAGMLSILGAQASLGRLIEEPDDDPDGPAVVVLSHGYWQRRFGSDPHVIGTTISIYEQPYEVIGVMAPSLELPPEAGAPAALVSTDLWLPLRLNSAGPFYNTHNLPTIARLRRDTRLDAAQAEFDRLTSSMPTSQTCFSCEPRFGGAKSRSAQRSAPAPAPSCGTSSQRASCSHRPAARSRSFWPCGVWTRSPTSRRTACHDCRRYVPTAV